jgi:hypothetical protein
MKILENSSLEKRGGLGRYNSLAVGQQRSSFVVPNKPEYLLQWFQDPLTAP